MTLHISRSYLRNFLVLAVTCSASKSLYPILSCQAIPAHNHSDDIICPDAHVQIGDGVSDDLLGDFRKVFFIFGMITQQIIKQADQEV